MKNFAKRLLPGKVWEYDDGGAFSSEVGVNKSNPDVYLLAAKRIGIPPEECTVFEDITTGIGGAKKGGFSTCAIFDETNADETDALKQLKSLLQGGKNCC